MPTEFQKERSLYTTPEEMRVVAKREVVRRYNEVRRLAGDEIAKGNRSAASAMISRWNSHVHEDLERLISVDALNSGTISQLIFDGADIKRLMDGEPPEAGAFAQTAARPKRAGELF